MFSFWKNKLSQNTLEQLVSNFTDLVKELRESRQEEARLLNEKLQQIVDSKGGTDAKIVIQYDPDVQLSVFINGDQIFSKDTSRKQFDKIVELRKNKDAVGILNLLTGKEDDALQELIKEEQEGERIEEIVDEIRTLVTTGDFTVKGDYVYLTGINRSIPKIILDEFLALYLDDRTEEYEALKNFWRWLVINPNSRAVEEFFKLMEKYKVPITKEGFILAYRWADLATEAVNEELITFISKQYVKVVKWKKSPANFEVWKIPVETELNEDLNEDVDDDFEEDILSNTTVDVKYKYVLIDLKKLSSDIKGERVGNLKELYLDIPNMQSERQFTDHYTKKMNIRLGQEVSMPRTECDESSDSCSRGLHATFDSRAHYGNGNVHLLVAICPRDIVSVPYRDSKFRSCKYLPLAVLDKTEDSTTFLQKGEGLDLLEEYMEFKIDELKDQSETENVQELTAQRILPIRVNNIGEEVKVEQEVKEIADQLQEAFNISQRVKNIS